MESHKQHEIHRLHEIEVWLVEGFQQRQNVVDIHIYADVCGIYEKLEWNDGEDRHTSTGRVATMPEILGAIEIPGVTGHWSGQQVPCVGNLPRT